MSNHAPGQRAGHSQHESVIDPEVVMASVQGDVALLAEVIDLMLKSAPETVSQIGDAIDQEDSWGLEQSAHQLKGAVTIFGARRVYESSLALEEMGHCGDLSNAQHCYTALVEEMGQLEYALAKFIKEV